MIDLQQMLDRRARLIEPSFDALDRVVRTVHRRHRRRVVASGASVCLLATAFTAIVASRPHTASPERTQLASQLLGTTQALAVRKALGVEGRTKGAPDSVVVTERSSAGRVAVSLVHLRTGRSTKVALGGDDSTGAAVSPRGDAVAAVTGEGVVVASPRDPARQAVVPDTRGAEGPVSWDGTGSALFTRVNGEWLRVTNTTDAGGSEAARPSVERMSVPTIPGGPILLSVSPGGDVAALFGITYPEELPPVPHLYVGHFDGTAVTDLREIGIPQGALAGPMGWVGDNAFLLAPEPGKALVIRTDGSRVEVTPEGLENPCRAARTVVSCTADGPSLLGTNADGSLLFWKVSAVDGTDRWAPPILLLYYKTWLDGTHGVRLTGLAARFGPPVAPR